MAKNASKYQQKVQRRRRLARELGLTHDHPYPVLQAIKDGYLTRYELNHPERLFIPTAEAALA